MCGTTGDDGAGAVEYAILIAGVAAVIATAVYLFGGQVLDSFQNSCETVTSHFGSSSPSCEP